MRLGPADDATAVTAAQLRAVIDRLIAAGHWQPGDPQILTMADAGHDITRLAYVLADLPVELVGRIRSDRALRLPRPPRLPGTNGRPPKHGSEIALDKPPPGLPRSTPRAPRPDGTARQCTQTHPTWARTPDRVQQPPARTQLRGRENAQTRPHHHRSATAHT
jgi:hypothetical protein